MKLMLVVISAVVALTPALILGNMWTPPALLKTVIAWAACTTVAFATCMLLVGLLTPRSARKNKRHA